MMRQNSEIWLGLDLGISTVKAALFDNQGTLLAAASDEYLIMPDGDTVEVDPDVFNRAPMTGVIRKALQKWGGNPSQIRALSVSATLKP